MQRFLRSLSGSGTKRHMPVMAQAPTGLGRHIPATTGPDRPRLLNTIFLIIIKENTKFQYIFAFVSN